MKSKQRTAELVPVLVYKGLVIVGQGYYLIRDDGLQSNMTMFDDNGESLPNGDYTLLPCPADKKLVIVPVRVQ